MGQEIEIALAIPAQRLAAVRQALFSDADAKTRRLESTYFDTADGALEAAGTVLRIRRMPDSSYVQTIKTAAGPGLFGRQEFEQPADGATPDLAPLEQVLPPDVAAAVATAGVRPVYVTMVRRTSALAAIAGAEVELALDEGEIRAGDRKAPIREIEVELKSGPALAVYEAAERALAAGAGGLVVASKGERGSRLAKGAAPPVADDADGRGVRRHRPRLPPPVDAQHSEPAGSRRAGRGSPKPGRHSPSPIRHLDLQADHLRRRPGRPSARPQGALRQARRRAQHRRLPGGDAAALRGRRRPGPRRRSRPAAAGNRASQRFSNRRARDQRRKPRQAGARARALDRKRGVDRRRGPDPAALAASAALRLCARAPRPHRTPGAQGGAARHGRRHPRLARLPDRAETPPLQCRVLRRDLRCEGDSALYRDSQAVAGRPRRAERPRRRGRIAGGGAAGRRRRAVRAAAFGAGYVAGAESGRQATLAAEWRALARVEPFWRKER